jgi:hypothetical protein
VSHRLLALVSGLTLGDYFLWNWSLTNNRDVPALVSGLTLPPLILACAWLLALALARVLARSSRRSSIKTVRWRAGVDPRVQQKARQSRAPGNLLDRSASRLDASADLLDEGVGLADPTAASLDQSPASPASSPASSPRKLAA